MSTSVPVRAISGVVVLGVVLLASIALSPAAAIGALESLAGDPLTFGLLVAGLYVVRPLLAWPTTPLAVVVGYGYGVTLGVPIALVGVLVTVTPVYVAVRWFVADPDPTETAVLESSPSIIGRTSVGRVRDAARRYYETAGPIRGVTASRLAPIPSDISTAAAAISGVKLRHLLAGTALGELPWTVAAVVVGASTATITTDGLGGIGATLAVACAFAAALLLAGPAYQVARGRIAVD